MKKLRIPQPDGTFKLYDLPSTPRTGFSWQDVVDTDTLLRGMGIPVREGDER